MDIEAIESIIEYSFRNKSLLLHALKHRSYLNVTHESDVQSNERLEFLGDAVLDLIVTEHLYHHFPEQSEGQLSKKKSVLVSRQVLGHIMQEMELGTFLLINKGEEKTGGRDRLSNLANLFEALLGAIYLDSGYKASEDFVNHFLFTRRDEFLATKTYFNYKSSLLELAQARGWGFPHYNTLEESGPDHDKRFVVQVRVNDKIQARGTGRSKKKAEQAAARIALKKLKSSQN